MDAAIIEKEALQLSDTERALLADKLLRSLSRVSEELREAWIGESDSRLQAFREGKIASMDGSKAMNDLKARFAR